MSESEYADYNGLVELARQTAIEYAKEWIPKLCEALKRENPEMSNEDIRETVTKDCADVWSKATIRKFLPDEYKDPQKQEAAKKKHEKQLEEPIPAGMNPAENSSVSQKEQESEGFDRPRKDVYAATEHIEKIKREFSNRLDFETKKRDDIIKQKEDEIRKLRDSQDITDIPVKLVENKIGPVKVQNLSKISDFDRRWFQSLARRFGELVRRRLVERGNASIKFYILGKDRTTDTEYLIPVNFTVDLMNKSTEVGLDEARL